MVKNFIDIQLFTNKELVVKRFEKSALLSTFYLFFLLMISTLCSASDLERIIPPEIKNDAFYHTIYRLAKSEPLSTILEIGSSSGEGSTEAFVLGIAENPQRPTLFCMELSKPRFAELQKRYGSLPFVKNYNVSSVPLASFPTENEITSFLDSTPTNLNQYGHTEVLRWLKQDIDYVASANVPQHGIELIKKENNIKNFDLVLIDGSEFLGKAEFALIYGATFILLDDINAFKNYANYQFLLSDPLYELVEENTQLRNGYAVFKKK